MSDLRWFCEVLASLLSERESWTCLTALALLRFKKPENRLLSLIEGLGASHEEAETLMSVVVPWECILRLESFLFSMMKAFLFERIEDVDCLLRSMGGDTLRAEEIEDVEWFSWIVGG